MLLPQKAFPCLSLHQLAPSACHRHVPCCTCRWAGLISSLHPNPRLCPAQWNRAAGAHPQTLLALPHFWHKAPPSTRASDPVLTVPQLRRRSDKPSRVTGGHLRSGLSDAQELLVAPKVISLSAATHPWKVKGLSLQPWRAGPTLLCGFGQ